jgi:hypothetical protein
MAITPSPKELHLRAEQIGAQLRGVAPLGPPHPAPSAAIVQDRGIAAAAEIAASHIAVSASQLGAGEPFGFSVQSLLNRAAKKLPPHEAGAVMEMDLNVFDHGFWPALKTALEKRGLAMLEPFMYDTGGDVLLSVKGCRIRAAPTKAALEHAAVGPSPQAAGDATAAAPAAAAFGLAQQLCDDAARVLKEDWVNYGQHGYKDQNDPKLLRNVTVALEKAARQIGSIASSAPILAWTSSSRAKEMKAALARLLSAIPSASPLPTVIKVPERKANIGSENPRFMDAILGGLLRKGDSRDICIRLTGAIQDLFDGSAALLAASNAKPAIPMNAAPERFAEWFPYATPELLRRRGMKPLFEELIQGYEEAANAKAAGNYHAAKDAYRRVALDLALALGPHPLVADALIRLGDFSHEFGYADRASRAYAGAAEVLRSVGYNATHQLLQTTISKLADAADAWIAELDQRAANGTLRGESEFAYGERNPQNARKIVFGTFEQLGVKEIRAAKGPFEYSLPGASASDWSQLLTRSDTAPTPKAEFKSNTDREAFVYPIHYAIYGPKHL